MACGAPPASKGTPSVLLVTIDTLRADRVGRGLTPAIDALAQEGVSFTNTRATVPLTLPSHVSIMTGTLPPEHGVRENGVHRFDGSRPTLARLFRDAGYTTAAFVGAYVLDRRFGLSDGFEMYDDRIPRDPRAPARLESERRADQVVAAALKWLAGADASKPLFVWVHLYDPHAPHAPPAEFLKTAGHRAYEGEVAFADSQVGSLIRDVRRKVGPDLVVALAGDHGEGLGEHGEATHGMLLYDSTLRVPFIVAGPGVQGGTRNDAPASLRDLAPTLLARAGLQAPATMTGVDVIAGASTDIYAETTYPRAAGWSPVRALVDDRWKLLSSSGPELFDLSRDAGEKENVVARNASVAAAMRTRLDRIFESARTSPSATPDAADRLRALGYVAAAPSGRTPAGAPNPRDFISAWNRFEQALSLTASGRSAEALADLRTLAASFPSARVFQASYAQALKDAGRTPQALQFYRRLVSRWPDDATLFHGLALAARAAGERVEAMKAEQAALALAPDDPNAHNGLGLLHADAGRAADAAAAFEQATRLDSNNASFWTNLGNARRETGELAAASTAYQRAIDLDPRYADASNGMGVILVQQQRPMDAIPFFERAIAYDPAFHEARLNLGIALQENGETARAAEQYRKVVGAAPAGSREKRAASELLAALR